MTGRSVLIIAHPFPPAGGGGVQRTTKLVKYLPRCGWMPTVLTTQAELYPRRFGLEDRSLLDEIPPEVEVVRVPSPEALGDPRILRRLAPWTALPDRGRLWNRVALPLALWLHQKKKFEVIYATGGPFSSFLLARALGRLVDRRYVIDFRDAWTLRGAKRPLRPRIEAEHARLERLVVEDAGAVLFATTPMEETYAAAYPAIAGRTKTVINGFDEDDFPEMARPGPRAGPDDPVVFLHVGTFNWMIRPEPLLAGFRRARERDAAFARRARLSLIGQLGTTRAESEEFRAVIQKEQLGDAVEVLGYRPHAEAVRLERTADVLVLVTSGLREEQRAKTAEYLAAGRPIAALVVEGMAAEALLAAAPRVERARPDQPEAIAAALLRLFGEADRVRPGDRLPAPSDAIRIFSRRRQTEEIAAVLSSAAASTDRSPRWRGAIEDVLLKNL